LQASVNFIASVWKLYCRRMASFLQACVNFTKL